MTIVVPAPAKINLDLRVVGRQADGYHELRTVFQSVDLHDTVRLTVRPGPLTVRSRSRELPRDRRNIVWTAADRLWRVLGRPGSPQGVGVSITKAIPMAAGLGGGSSDAASALRGFRVLWGGAVADRILNEVAAGVGSDVPYFLSGGLVLGSGRGVQLRRLPDLDTYWVVLAVPQFGVSSAEAYRWFDRQAVRPLSGTLPRDWRRRLGSLHNDLQQPVVERHPSISEMVDRLRAGGAVHAAMTGSGSTVFGLFQRRVDAVSGRRAIRMSGWQTLLTRTVGRAEFARQVTVWS